MNLNPTKSFWSVDVRASNKKDFFFSYREKSLELLEDNPKRMKEQI